MELSTSAAAATSHGYAVGEIEVIVVADGERTAPVPEGFVLNAPMGRSRPPTQPTAFPRARATRRSIPR
jgi:hypothetical protein